ncbi:MAG: alpha/beta fold hydrolase [Anaeroplasmataceae bacterium]
MFIKIDDINISYEINGTGENIVFLHGWGSNKEIWNNVIRGLDGFKIIKLDLPGFGDTKIDKPYNINEVTNILYKFLIALKIQSPIIIAHSYGGRIAINYASMYDVKKLILVDSAGIKHNHKKRVGIYKFFKKLHIKLPLGSKDYKLASPIHKIMLVDAVNTDLSDILYKIKCPTLLIWGSNDKDIPYDDMLIMKDNIKDSGIVVIKDAGHFPFIDEYLYFMRVILYFLECDIDV